jgi:MOSC domain-containing protein YiiM
MSITSHSTGSADRFRTSDDLRRSLADLPAAPKDSGRVILIVRRMDKGQREAPDRLQLTPEAGVPGDTWSRQRRPDPDAQIAVMQADVARLIANGQPLELFGDQLFLELDLSVGNLPPGSRLQVGSATVEVTPMPHNGCGKFRERFGLDAVGLVSDPQLRHRNLRGIYLRVVEPGEVAVGDPVAVVSRTIRT